MLFVNDFILPDCSESVCHDARRNVTLTTVKRKMSELLSDAEIYSVLMCLEIIIGTQ
jgi:hypothetical protein